MRRRDNRSKAYKPFFALTRVSFLSLQALRLSKLLDKLAVMVQHLKPASEGIHQVGSGLADHVLMVRGPKTVVDVPDLPKGDLVIAFQASAGPELGERLP